MAWKYFPGMPTMKYFKILRITVPKIQCKTLIVYIYYLNPKYVIPLFGLWHVPKVSLPYFLYARAIKSREKME